MAYLVDSCRSGAGVEGSRMSSHVFVSVLCSRSETVLWSNHLLGMSDLKMLNFTPFPII